MRFLYLVFMLVFSLGLVSQTSREPPVDDGGADAQDEAEGYYSKEGRDPVYIDQKTEQIEVATTPPCNCDMIQSQEEAPVYFVMPPPQPQQQVAPTGIDYSRPQVGPDLYKQYQSGNYQYQGYPLNQ